MDLQIDHVIAVVDDLDGAADRLFETHGLASLPGGRHPGHGTANRIVPLGATYLELMAVVDPAEARTSTLGRWAQSRSNLDIAVAAVCLRTDHIRSVSAALDEPAVAMSRATPDGSTLSWRLVGLAGMIEHGWPFFIQWEAGPSHPGRSSAPHRVTRAAMTAVTLEGAPPALHDDVAAVEGVALAGEGLAVVITTDEGTIAL